jgi:hypothetical protein
MIQKVERGQLSWPLTSPSTIGYNGATHVG